jgi:hypothetical protein
VIRSMPDKRKHSVQSEDGIGRARADAAASDAPNQHGRDSSKGGFDTRQRKFRPSTGARRQLPIDSHKVSLESVRSFFEAASPPCETRIGLG